MAKKTKKRAKKATAKKATKRWTAAARAKRRAVATVNVCTHVAEATTAVDKVLKDLREMGVPSRHIKKAMTAKKQLGELLKSCVG